MKNKFFKNEDGFTLIELMIVVAIIGILAAIAIPQFSAYRQNAYDATARADLRNAATAQEAYFVEHEGYTQSAGRLVSASYGFAATSDKVVLTLRAASLTTYSMITSNVAGGKSYILKGPGGSISDFN